MSPASSYLRPGPGFPSETIPRPAPLAPHRAGPPSTIARREAGFRPRPIGPTPDLAPFSCQLLGHLGKLAKRVAPRKRSAAPGPPRHYQAWVLGTSADSLGFTEPAAARPPSRQPPPRGGGESSPQKPGPTMTAKGGALVPAPPASPPSVPPAPGSPRNPPGQSSPGPASRAPSGNPGPRPPRRPRKHVSCQNPATGGRPNPAWNSAPPNHRRGPGGRASGWPGGSASRGTSPRRRKSSDGLKPDPGRPPTHHQAGSPRCRPRPVASPHHVSVDYSPRGPKNPRPARSPPGWEAWPSPPVRKPGLGRGGRPGAHGVTPGSVASPPSGVSHPASGSG